MFSALQRASGPLTQRNQRPNRSIIGDAILPQTGTKLTKKRGSTYVWRSIVAPSDATEKKHNIGAQL